MTARARVSFSEFKQAVQQSIAEYAKKKLSDKDEDNSRVQNNRDYFHAVGEAARDFRDAEFGRTSQKKDEAWLRWFGSFKDELKDSWEGIKNTSATKISHMERGTGDLRVAYAIHYRLHAEVDCPQFAISIDEKIFGNAFEYKFHTPVFEDTDVRLPVQFPHYISLNDNYQRQRKEFLLAKKVLLDTAQEAVTPSVAIVGAAGYGKTSIAEELVLDQRTREAFPGGIYWVQYGLRFGLHSNKLRDVISSEEAFRTMLRNQFQGFDYSHINLSSPERILNALPSQRFLIVADDIWIQSQLDFLKDLPPNASILISTRDKAISNRASTTIEVTSLSEVESFEVLRHGVEGNLSAAEKDTLERVCMSFKGWPLLLNLANGRLRSAYDLGNGVVEVLNEYGVLLSNDNITGWDEEGIPDGDNARRRRRLVKLCIDTSLHSVLKKNERKLFCALAVFPDDIDIPFHTINLLWREISQNAKPNDRILPETLMSKLERYSLLRGYDKQKRVLRLHDEMHAYVRGTFSAKKMARMHEALVVAIQSCCSDGWANLPGEDRYAWNFLLVHLEQAKRVAEANKLRIDYGWLNSALKCLDVAGLQQLFRSQFLSDDAKLVGRAIDMSAHVLRESHAQFALQIYGRLGHQTESCEIKNLVDEALANAASHIRPRWAHLKPVDRVKLILKTGEEAVKYAQFGWDGRRIVTLAKSGLAIIWDAETGEMIKKLHDGSKKDYVNSVRFAPDRRRFVTASEHGIATIWDTQSGAQIGKPLVGHRGPVKSAEFDSAGKRIVTASYDGTAIIWDAQSGTPIGNPLKGHGKKLYSAQFDRAGELILTASWDGKATIWDVQTGERMGELCKEDYKSLTSKQFEWEAGRVVTATANNEANLREAKASQTINKLQKGQKRDYAKFGRLDPDRGRIILVDRYYETEIWVVQPGERIGKPLVGHRGSVNAAEFDSAGKRIVTSSEDGTAIVWDAQSGMPIGNPLKMHGKRVNSAQFDPAGKRIVTSSDDGTAIVWDVRSDERKGKRYKLHNSRIVSVQFDRAGKRIVTVSKDGTARIWDAKTGEPIGKPLCRHRSSIISAQFDLEGKRIVTVSTDGTVSSWDLRSGELIGKPVRAYNMSMLNSAQSDRDGKRVVTCSGNGTAMLWNLDSPNPSVKSLKGRHY
ncbi:NB-ARC domain-containing protein, partial [Rhodopirellula bahusiensis]|uniref:NB-ARC domain-containing protein n=1 Tax=Rhodopirellula bahusiensis TaxID=2014065 RepID=UPI003299AE13